MSGAPAFPDPIPPPPRARRRDVREEGLPAVAVISGLSGAGRTEAAKVLEDLGFFVIDNLPPSLVDRVVELAARPGSSVDRIAVVADVRGREFFSELMDALAQLRRARHDVRVLFLEANDDTLVRRFEAVRRPHPLGADDGVMEGIRRERELLHELRGEADLVLDTSELNVHELRERIVGAFGAPETAAMRIAVESFGYKYGLPRDADVVIDVRFLPNPHWVDELRPYTGLDAPVQAYVLTQPATGPFLEQLQRLVDLTLPGYLAEGRHYLTIAIGCTGGKHRSVVIGEHLAQHLREVSGLPVHVEHRDVGRE